MANQFVQDGNYLDYTAGEDIAAGTPVLIGTLVCVAPRAMANGEKGSLATTGVWQVPKAAGAAWAQGASVYWDVADAEFNTTASGNVFAGHAAEDALSAATEGKILLR